MKFLDWAKSHRGILGWVVGVFAAGLGAKGYTGPAAVLAPISTLLLGAGHFESDASKQSK